MPDQYLVPFTACGFKKAFSGHQSAFRGIIDSVHDGNVVVRAADHGWLTEVAAEDLRVLSVHFAKPPQVCSNIHAKISILLSSFNISDVFVLVEGF